MENLLEFDRRWSARISFANRPAALRSMGALLAHSGDSWFWGAGLAALWVLGDADQKQWAIRLLIGIFVTALIVIALKFLILSSGLDQDLDRNFYESWGLVREQSTSGACQRTWAGEPGCCRKPRSG